MAYAWGLLGLIVVAILYLRFMKYRRRRLNGKRKRRSKKTIHKSKNSNINADPLLQQMADDQLLAKE